MGLNKCSGNGQPKPAATLRSGASPIHTVEALADAWQLFLRDANALVSDGDAQAPLRVWLQIDLNDTSRARILDGVVQKIDEDLVDAIAIGQDRWKLGTRNQLECDTAQVGLRGQPVDYRPNQVGKVQLLSTQIEGLRIGP
jgi:hypothetical protein